MKLLLFILCLGFNNLVFADSIKKISEQMKPGEWKKIETIGFDKDLLNSSGKTILPYSNKAGWDQKTETLHFIGMCHMTPPMKHITFDAKSNTWSSHNPEDWYKDNKWFHAYDNSTAGDGNFYHGFWGSTLWQFNVAQKTWKEFPKVPIKGSHGAALAYFPELGKSGSLIQLFGRNGIQIFDLATEKWSTHEKKLEVIGPYHNICFYNPKRKSVILGGGNGCKVLYELNSKNEIKQLPEAPISIGVNYSNCISDPASGEILLREYKKHTELHCFNFEENKWNTISSEQSISGHAVVASLSNYHVTLWFNHSGVYLYKHK